LFWGHCSAHIVSVPYLTRVHLPYNDVICLTTMEKCIVEETNFLQLFPGTGRTSVVSTTSHADLE